MCELTEQQESDTISESLSHLPPPVVSDLETLRRQALSIAQYLNKVLGYEPLLTGKERKRQQE